MVQVHQEVEGRALLLGPANLVTLVRFVLTCVVLGLAVQSLEDPRLTSVVVAFGGSALALDGVDGWLARRTGTCTPFGARFDMETDALLILALSVYVAPTVGWWVLLIGTARYLLWLAQRLWPSLRGEVPPRRWRKVVAAVQGVVLVSVASGLLPVPLAVLLLLVALASLAVSFGTEVAERRGVDLPPARQVRGVALSVLAVALVWLALAAPDGGSHLSPWLLVRVPVEGMVLIVVVVVVSDRWAGRLGFAFGLLAAVLVVLKAFNVGFTMVLDRPFDVSGDWFYFSSAVGVLGDSVGRPVAWLVVALLAVLGAGLFVLLPWMTRRVCRLARRRRAPAVGVAAGVTLLALLLTWTGLGPGPDGRAFAAASAALAVDEAVGVRADLHDRTVFAGAIATDPFANRGPLLQRLRGKDVLLVFVESYGRSALHDSTMAAGVDAVLARGTEELRRAGYHARSAYLTSPTFGGASWLAHSTLQSGLWVDSQRRYNQLLGSDRLTLARAFGQAGWRTVFDVPSVTSGWAEGQRFYGFDQLYDAGNVGYRGPMFGYATMPDQYTLSYLRTAELLPRPRKPVMAEVDLVSSHHPWAPLPHLVGWNDVGDGSVFDGMPQQGDTVGRVFSDAGRVRAAYAQSIEYSLQTLFTFLTTYPDKDLVVVMLGDHQPYHYVSGGDAGYDVPVSILAQDPSVLSDVSGWGWTPGLRPGNEAPVWPMSSVRDRFLTAFSGR